jgi:hypothetical protein
MSGTAESITLHSFSSPMRDSQNKCRTVSWPKILDTALDRAAREKGTTVSNLLRGWVLPMLRERDEKFDREWTLRSSRIRYGD